MILALRVIGLACHISYSHYDALLIVRDIIGWKKGGILSIHRSKMEPELLSYWMQMVKMKFELVDKTWTELSQNIYVDSGSIWCNSHKHCMSNI